MEVFMQFFRRFRSASVGEHKRKCRVSSSDWHFMSQSFFNSWKPDLYSHDAFDSYIKGRVIISNRRNVESSSCLISTSQEHFSQSTRFKTTVWLFFFFFTYSSWYKFNHQFSLNLIVHWDYDAQYNLIWFFIPLSCEQ